MTRSDGRRARRAPADRRRTRPSSSSRTGWCSGRRATRTCSARRRSRSAFRAGSTARGRGWVTAEYSLLPASTGERTEREASRGKQGGRTVEIQRLIGRSVRAVVDFEALGERTVWLDCDVLQADGGTRCAAICGSYVAAQRALERFGLSKALTGAVGAVSVGVVEGETLLDLNYEEDSTAEVDVNVVMTARRAARRGAGDGRARPVRPRRGSTRCSTSRPSGSRSSRCTSRRRSMFLSASAEAAPRGARGSPRRTRTSWPSCAPRSRGGSSSRSSRTTWPEETGATYEENARLKARFGRALAAAGRVGARRGLGDRVRRARRVRRGCTRPAGRRRATRRRVARAARRRAEPQRADGGDARGRLAWTATELRGSGVLEGTIALGTPRRGRLRLRPDLRPDGEQRTVAELGDDWKREHSHRGRAAGRWRRRSGGARVVAPSLVSDVPGTVLYTAQRGSRHRPARAADASSPPRRARSRSPSRRATRAAAPATKAPAAPGCGSTRCTNCGRSWNVASRITAAATAPGSTSRHVSRGVREHEVRRREEDEDAEQRHGDGHERRDGGVVDEAAWRFEQLGADRARHERREQHDERARPSSATPAPSRAGSRGSAGRRRC